jgi:hypothetical protein
MSRGALGLLLLALSLAGCQRGCLREKVDEAVDRKHGVAAPLAQVDCPDGLARCVEGVVQSSRLYAYSVPCAASPEACTCPWERVTICARGCAAEDVILPIPAAAAADQLCAPSGAVLAPAAAPMLAPTAPPSPSSTAPVPWTSPTDLRACEGERFRCSGGQVNGCEPTVHVIGRCLLGCAVEDATVEDEQVTDRQAADVLCRHAAPASAPASMDSGTAGAVSPR